MIRRKDNKNRVLKEGEYQRTNGTFEYKWRDKRGKRRSVYAKTLEELREKEVDIMRDTLDGIRADKNDLTVNDLYYKWVQLKRGLKANTIQFYKYLYVRYVESSIGNTHIVDLKRSDVKAFYNHLADKYHFKFKTISSIHAVLRQVLELGVEDEYLRYNPADNALRELKKACEATEKKRALTIAEQNVFEEYLSKWNKHHRCRPVFIVMLYTGMRVGEAAGLRWEDVDFEKGVINVNHTLAYYKKSDGKCSFAINTPKSKSGERSIPMLPKVREALIEEKQYQQMINVTCKSVIDGYTNFIFVNQFGNVQSQIAINRELHHIIKDCNKEILSKGEKNPVLLPTFTNHSLRHTFTTRMCEAGINVKAMQDILGHADAETTLQIYADATEEMKKTELINFEDYFNKLKIQNG